MNECPLCRASAGDRLSCAGCVKNTLYYKQQAVAYKKLALRDAYEQAKVVLTARQPIFEEEQAVADLTRRQGEMRRRLQETAESVRDLRIALARKTFSVNERRRALASAMSKLDEAKRQQESQSFPVLKGLEWYREQAMEALRQRMWTRVLEHFVIFPIEADVPGLVRPPSLPPSLSASSSKQNQPQQLQSRGHHFHNSNLLPGVSTIAGLPVPNSGLYSELGLPDEVCEAALYLVARVTWSLANTLGVELPHPLRFPAGKPYALVMEDGKGRTEFALSPSIYASSSTTTTNSTNSIGRSRHTPLIIKRDCGREEEGTDPFSLALEALQFNVHRLAISPTAVGVDASELFGKEALLLNLWAIQRQAARVVKAYEGFPDVPLPQLKEGRRGERKEAEVRGQHQQQCHQQQHEQEGGCQQHRHQLHGGAPRVVFEDREGSEWSLVELQNQVDAFGGGVGGRGGEGR